MAVKYKEDLPSQGSSDTNVPDVIHKFKNEKLGGPPGMSEEKAEDDYENLNYPPA